MRVNRCWSCLLFFLALVNKQSFKASGANLCSPPCLLVSNTSDIIAIDYKASTVTPVVTGLSGAVAIDVHFSLGYVFWSDVIDLNIKRFSIGGSTTTIISNTGVCGGLAVHWRTSQLYWTDQLYDKISVSDLDGNNQGSLIHSGLDAPRDIALDPDNGLMIWTDVGTYPKIEKASLNGNQRVTIVTTHLYLPNGIELDKGNKRIFWVDAGYDSVETVDYYGNNRKTLFHHDGLHPFGVALIAPFLFFTDWYTYHEVHKLDATAGNVIRSYNISSVQPMGIVAYDSARQSSASSPCAVSNGGCSHFCVTKTSGYECVCPTGVTTKKDGKTCEDRIRKFILFTDADDRSTNFISLDVNYIISQTFFAHPGNQRPIALDFDPVEERVYWSDVYYGGIFSAFSNATSLKTLFHCNVQTPDGLAIDHVGRNIYWTDTGTNRIEVGRLDGTRRGVLIKDGLDQPRAIVLYEKKGKMYWTDWGASPKIEQAGMDGSARQTIVTGNLGWPNGLTIDQATNRLFWADAKLDKIESSDLTGENRHLILSSSADIHPYGLTVHQDMLYWTDWNTKSISRFNLSNATREEIVSGLQKPMDIHVFDPSLIFSGPHNCSLNNGLCSDLCLLKPGGYQCACPTGVELKSDEKNCDYGLFDKASSNKFVIFAEADIGKIYKVPLQVPETPCYPLEISTNISRPVAVDYDPVEGKIYWSDVTAALVARAFPNGSSAEVIAHNNVTTPAGLALDYIGRNIYWTDEANNRIEVAKIDGSSRRSLITSNIEKPRAILLDIEERKMYWGGRGVSLKIEQANMDGSARTTLVSSGLTWVNSLAMDYQGRLLYWCDGYHDKIERVDLQGNNRVVILDLSLDAMHPFGLALFGDVLFWSDWNSRNIHKYNMTTSVNESVVHGMGRPMELHVYDKSELFTGSTSCSQLNGGCSHLCLPNPSGHQCFCPEGVQLKPGDAFTCEGVNSCPQLTAPAHGSLAPCNNFPGHVCHFSCDIGYNLTGSATRTCDSNGVWTGTQPQCNAVITCSALLTPPNGIRQGCTGTITENYGTVCLFSCIAGFIATGSPSRECLADGTWSGQDFLCRGPLHDPVTWYKITHAGEQVAQWNFQKKATLCSPPCLLVANTSDVVAMDYKTSALSPVVSGLTRAVAIDFHFSLGYLFWSDVTELNIKRFHVEVASTTTIITSIGVCDGLAVDWRASQLYWTDTTYDTISVSDLDGNNQGLLISSGLDKPRAIALDLDNSLMFWTDWGINRKIEKASLNGGHRVAIVATDLLYPGGIELDTGNKRIFWVDAGYDRVESVDYNGTNRKLLYQLRGLQPFGLTLFPPFLFFTDWVTDEDIHQLDATTGRVVRKFNVNGGRPMGIVAYDASRQPAASNPCTVNNGGCSHFCVAKSSGYECVCPTGVAVKQDGKTCEDKVNKFILFADADDNSTRYVSLDTTYFATQTLFHHLGTQRPIALDYDPVEDRVYWSDIAQGRILSAFFNATSAKTLFRCNVRTPDGLAVDYVGRNIYWTDTGTNRIEVGKLDGTARKLLIKGGLDEPRAIVLDEKNGMMYWTDWGSSPKIEKAEMDGSARRIIVAGNLVWPNGLTIHQATNRLFWADAKLDKIEVSDLNGRNRQTIMSSVADIHPYGLAVYHDMLYWTDWNAKSISNYNLSNRNNGTLVDGLRRPMDIHVFDPALIFSGSHKCSQINGICSDFCLLKPGGYQCACPTGIALKSDGKTCDHGMFDKTSSDKFVIFAEADTGEIYKVPLQVPEAPCYPLEISTNISRPVAVDYDPVERKIYWSDVTLNIIARAFPNGSSVDVIAYNNVITPAGLALDYIGRNIYWTDEANNRIEVAKMDGSSRRSLITSNIEKPRAIILDIGERKMYWGGRGVSLKIEQANMDGSARTTLVSSGLTWVNSLAMDYQSKLLYWCDGYHDKIERVDLQGNNRVVILDLSLDSMHPFGLALFGDVLFWSDWNSQSIHKLNMTASVDEVVVHGMGRPMELHVYDQSKLFTGSTSCSQLNGGCSHLCLPNPSGHQCFCPEGVQLKPGDAFTCEGVRSCPQLTAPSHGSLSPCNNFQGQICRFSCDIGYILTGSATRECDSNGVWTGTHPQCNGLHRNNNKVLLCFFSCNAGFVATGSPLRKCLDNGTCSGKDFLCQAVSCVPLSIPPKAILLTVSCGNTYGSNCVLGCQSGYASAGGNVTRTCLQTGQWSSNPINCKDIQEPSITCPPDMDNIPTEPGQSYARVQWQLPVPTDNSNQPLTLTGLRPPQKLNVGKTYIKYEVTDSSGLRRSCVFFIHVKDLEPPKIANCPDDIHKTSQQKWTKVFFPEVTVTDNVGVHLVTTSRPNGSEFTWGEHNVTYTASDVAGNTAKCHFQIVITAKPCDDLSTPQNGGKACDKWLNGGKVCTLHCNEGYDFANKLPELYACGAGGKWHPDGTVPDCSKTRQAKTLLASELHYLADQCTEEMHASIANNFIALYTQYLGTVGGCDGDVECTIENVNVECGGLSGTLRRRAIPDNEQAPKVPLTVKFAVKVPLPSNASEIDLNQTTQQISSDILASLNETDLTLKVRGVVLEYDTTRPPVVRILGLVCDKGQVLKGTKCVNCPLGYFFNSGGCQACVEDHYQDQEAQNECVTCPSGTSTFGQTGSKGSKDCQEIPSPSSTEKQVIPAMILYPVIALGSVLIIAVIVVAIFFLRKRCLGSRRPANPAGSNGSGTEGNMGFDNRALRQTNSVPANEPEYLEIGQLQQPSVGFSNPAFESGDHYQALNNAVNEPNTVYEEVNFNGQ